VLQIFQNLLGFVLKDWSRGFFAGSEDVGVKGVGVKGVECWCDGGPGARE